jgi:hypothetical protein
VVFCEEYIVVVLLLNRKVVVDHELSPECSLEIALLSCCTIALVVYCLRLVGKQAWKKVCLEETRFSETHRAYLLEILVSFVTG